jgi:DNA adenine methylase
MSELFVGNSAISSLSRRTDRNDDLRYLYPMSWLGTKIRLLPDIENHLPKFIMDGEKFRYVEPFTGGGSVLFRFLYRSLVQKVFAANEFFAFDSNGDLLTLYFTLKNHPEALLNYLIKMQEIFNSLSGEKRQRYYYQVRNRFNEYRSSLDLPEATIDPLFDIPVSVQDSARFLFLTETGYGRRIEYSKGNMCVCFNKVDYMVLNKPLKFRYSVLRKCSELLQKVSFGLADFEAAAAYLGIANKSFCYLDPPYVKIDKRLSIIKYGMKTFGPEDHQRLAALMRTFSSADQKTWLMMSNAAHGDAENTIKTIFKGFHLSKIMVERRIGTIGRKSGEIDYMIPEYLVTSYRVNNLPKTLF